MNGIIRRVFIAGLLLLAFVCYGCAGTGTSGGASWGQGAGDYNGDVGSSYPPYHHPSH